MLKRILLGLVLVGLVSCGGVKPTNLSQYGEPLDTRDGMCPNSSQVLQLRVYADVVAGFLDGELVGILNKETGDTYIVNLDKTVSFEEVMLKYQNNWCNLPVKKLKPKPAKGPVA